LDPDRVYRFELGAIRMASHPFMVVTTTGGVMVGSYDATGVTVTARISEGTYTYKCAAHPAVRRPQISDLSKMASHPSK